jgi:hypothetical protein
MFTLNIGVGAAVEKQFDNLQVYPISGRLQCSAVVVAA